MERSQLKKIIKEEIKRLQNQPLQEQVNPILTNSLMNGFGTYLANNGINFKEVLSCGHSLNTPSASSSQTNMLGWLQGIFALQGPAGTPIFPSLPPSTSNMPCQFINNKITQLQNWISNFTSNPNYNQNSQQLRLKRCKLKIFMHLAGWYGC